MQRGGPYEGEGASSHTGQIAEMLREDALSLVVQVL